MDFSWLFISKTQLLKFTEFETIQNLNILTWENFYLASSNLIRKTKIEIFFQARMKGLTPQDQTGGQQLISH